LDDAQRKVKEATSPHRRRERLSSAAAAVASGTAVAEAISATATANLAELDNQASVLALAVENAARDEDKAKRELNRNMVKQSRPVYDSVAKEYSTALLTAIPLARQLAKLNSDMETETGIEVAFPHAGRHLL